MNLHPGKLGWPAFYALQARTCRNPALRAYYQVLRGIVGKSGLTDREAGKLAVAKHTLHLSLLSPCILLILLLSGQATKPLPVAHPPTTPF